MTINARGKQAVSVETLKAEGVLDLGGVESVLFVRTKIKLHIFHAQDLPLRTVDPYLFTLISSMVDAGHGFVEVCQKLDLNLIDTAAAMRALGFQRTSRLDGKPRQGANARVAAAGRRRRDTNKKWKGTRPCAPA